MSVEIVPFGGWEHNARLTNGEVELIVTLDVGPRIIRYGFVDQMNVLKECPDQLGGMGENSWRIRGGHRLWAAPESAPFSYEADNDPVDYMEIDGGLRTIQHPGPVTGLRKIMDIRLVGAGNRVEVRHTLENTNDESIECASWALTVMTTEGEAFIPLPEKRPHGEYFLNNQNWSLWSFTDLSDPRWMLGPRYVRLRQDPDRGATKLGVMHREGWVAYLVKGFLFVKYIEWVEDMAYPDGGVNFETFSNESILELESLSPLVSLAPGASISHRETWNLHRDVPDCPTEDDVEKHIVSLV